MDMEQEELRKPRVTSILPKRQVKGYIKSKEELKRAWNE